MMTALNRSVTLVKARKTIILAVIGVVKDRCGTEILERENGRRIPHPALRGTGSN